MDSPQKAALNSLAQQAYCTAFAHHGDLDLETDRYISHLVLVTRKHLGANLSEGTAFAFINKLHTNDLYLSVACAKPADVAWERFIALYQAFIVRVARAISSTDDTADTIANRITGHIFLPGGSGCSRIASYEGRSSLATWLSAIINNLAVQEQSRCSKLEQLESLLEIPDYAVPHGIVAALRAAKYASVVWNSLIVASESLSEQERLILVLRYEDGLQGSEIAAILKVHPSTVTRHLQLVYEKLRCETISTLESKHQLSPSAIKECVDDIRENPDYSILSLLRKRHLASNSGLDLSQAP